MDSDQCHICLDEIEYISINLMKECCNAFICNPCWTTLKNNQDIKQCPICKKEIREREYVEISTQTTIDNCCTKILHSNLIKIMCHLILSILVALLSVIIVSFIVNYNDIEEFKRDINYIFKYSLIDFYLWIFLILWGYILITFSKYCMLRICS